MLDVGLVSSALGLDLPALENMDVTSLVNQGALVEQAVGQLLRGTFTGAAEPELFYWQRDKRDAEAELDYVHAVGARVCPIEVKAGASGAMRSLHQFMAERRLPLGVRLYAGPPQIHPVEAPVAAGRSVQYRLLSLPFYLTEHLPRLFSQVISSAPR
jgi:hypothetical protein